MDKIAACGFTVGAASGAPYIEQARLVLVCKKVYWQDLNPQNFLDGETEEKWYPQKDYHRMFIGRVEEVLKRK